MNTYPTSSYDDLGKVIPSLGIGEAIVTVMNERGAPTPVAWTRLRAPESLMGPADAAAMDAAVKASPRLATYSAVIDRESAREKLAARMEAGAVAASRRPRRRPGQGGEGRPQAEAARPRRPQPQEDDGLVHDVVTSRAPSRTSCAPPPARSPGGCSSPGAADPGIRAAESRLLSKSLGT